MESLTWTMNPEEHICTGFINSSQLSLRCTTMVLTVTFKKLARQNLVILAQ